MVIDYLKELRVTMYKNNLTNFPSYSHIISKIPTQ